MKNITFKKDDLIKVVTPTVGVEAGPHVLMIIDPSVYYNRADDSVRALYLVENSGEYGGHTIELESGDGGLILMKKDIQKI